MERPVPYVHPLEVRYLEADRQGVVFNMWYLAYADDALAGFLAAGGLPAASWWPAATTSSWSTPSSTGRARSPGGSRPP
jgi:hypothetical protein